MLAIVADMRRDISGFLKIGRFKETDREGKLRFYTSASAPNVVAATGGFREDNAAQSVRSLINRFDPQTIVSAGFASAGKPNLKNGDIVVCDRVLAEDGPAYSWRMSNSTEIETDPAIIEEIRGWLTVSDVNFEIGACVTLPQLVTNSPMKEWLGRTFDAPALDINSYWVVKAVVETRRACIPVKVIADSMNREMSPLVFETLRLPARKRFVQSTKYVAANPLRVFRVVKLAAQAQASRKSLSKFLHRLARTRIAIE